MSGSNLMQVSARVGQLSAVPTMKPPSTSY